MRVRETSNPTSLLGSCRRWGCRAKTECHFVLNLSTGPHPCPHHGTHSLHAQSLLTSGSSRIRRSPGGLWDELHRHGVRSGPAWANLSLGLLIKTPDVRRAPPFSLKGDIPGVWSLEVLRLPVTLGGRVLCTHPPRRQSRQVEGPRSQAAPRPDALP